jgi:hypothetical protein
MSRVKDWIMEMESHVWDAMELGMPRANVYPYVCTQMHGASEREVDHIIDQIQNHYYGYTFNENGEMKYVTNE